MLVILLKRMLLAGNLVFRQREDFEVPESSLRRKEEEEKRKKIKERRH